MVGTSRTNNNQKDNRKIIHAENLSEEQEQGVIRLYNELVLGDNTRTIDVQMITTEAFPKFEETIGKEGWYKVKKYFGIEGKPNLKPSNEIKCLVSKLRTIENAQYYIVGYKELVKKLAGKLYNAPENMTDIVKAKIIAMFCIIFADEERFFKDYAYNQFASSNNKIVFSEQKALLNNKQTFGPEELFDIFNMKVRQTEGYYYDMMILPFKRMILDNLISMNRYKSELEEIEKFAEIKYNSETGEFTSINKCMLGATFAKIRRLKQRVHQVRGAYGMEIFCNKKVIQENIDITELYVIYKTLSSYPWKKDAEKKKLQYRTMSGSRFVEKQQEYYVLLGNFLIADDAEAERWTSLFEYVTKYEIVLSTKVDGNGEYLTESKFYNTGVLGAVLNYAMDMGFISLKTMVKTDFEVADRLLALEDAYNKFLKLKRGELKVEQMKELLGIDEEFEKDILQLKKIEEERVTEIESIEDSINEDEGETGNTLKQNVIKFVLENGYAESEEKINLTLVKNVFIPGNEDIIKKLSKGEITESEFEKIIGFEEEFAESYFDTSKFDVKAVEAKLQDLKRSRKKEQICKSKLLIALYCYIIKNGISCGPKNKPAKRNKGLKPEILEQLIS